MLQTQLGISGNDGAALFLQPLFSLELPPNNPSSRTRLLPLPAVLRSSERAKKKILPGYLFPPRGPQGTSLRDQEESVILSQGMGSHNPGVRSRLCSRGLASQSFSPRPSMRSKSASAISLKELCSVTQPSPLFSLAPAV